MVIAWILWLLDSVASVVTRVNLPGLRSGLSSGEPRAWLVLIAAVLGLWALFSLLGASRPHPARRARRAGSAWDPFDVE